MRASCVERSARPVSSHSVPLPYCWLQYFLRVLASSLSSLAELAPRAAGAAAAASSVLADFFALPGAIHQEPRMYSCVTAVVSGVVAVALTFSWWNWRRPFMKQNSYVHQPSRR